MNHKLVRYGAILLLVALAFLYTSGRQEGLMQMRPQWWGILGLIGWAYLVAALIYIPFRNNQPAISTTSVTAQPCQRKCNSVSANRNGNDSSNQVNTPIRLLHCSK